MHVPCPYSVWLASSPAGCCRLSCTQYQHAPLHACPQKRMAQMMNLEARPRHSAEQLGRSRREGRLQWANLGRGCFHCSCGAGAVAEGVAQQCMLMASYRSVPLPGVQMSAPQSAQPRIRGQVTEAGLFGASCPVLMGWALRDCKASAATKVWAQGLTHSSRTSGQWAMHR